MLSKKEGIKLASFTIGGALLGYAYYYFIGCKNGCPLQSNAAIMTLYGAFTGGIIGFPLKKKKIEEPPKNETE
ncbi:MAG: hypothetical protein IT279_09430 [Ignavibacteriaceae bacterium]|nr:hypothetical protein [Ignavibacteriaceae bacterium]